MLREDKIYNLFTRAKKIINSLFLTSIAFLSSNFEVYKKEKKNQYEKIVKFYLFGDFTKSDVVLT